MLSNVTIMISIGGVGLAYITTVLCARLPHREHFAAKATVLALLLVCYVFLAPLERMGVFIHLPMVAIIFLYVGQCYQVTAVEALFISIAGYTIEHISSLVNSILTVIDPDRFAHFGEDITTNFWGYALIVVSYVITYALARFLLIRRMRGLSLLKNATGSIVALSAVMLVVNQIWGLTFELYGAEYAGSLLCVLEYSRADLRGAK